MGEQELTLAEACRLLGLSREQLMRRVHRGDLVAEKRGGHWVVDLRSVDAFRRRSQSPTGLPVPPELADLFEVLERAHQLGVAREAELMALEGDARSAETAGDPGRAGALREVVRQLRTARYSWDSDVGRWRLTVGDVTALAPAADLSS
jgi:excisionase family DNA binding protein